MANYTNLVNNFWHKVQQNSVGWGSLALWIFGLVVVLVLIAKYANA